MQWRQGSREDGGAYSSELREKMVTFLQNALKGCMLMIEMILSHTGNTVSAGHSGAQLYFQNSAWLL